MPLSPHSVTAAPAAPLRPRWLALLVTSAELLSSLCMFVTGIMMVILIAIFGWLVFGRYVLNNTPTWVEQMSLMLIVWITFLGAAVGVWRNTHLSIGFLRDALPERPREVMTIAADLLLGVFGAFMAWYGVTLVTATGRRIVPMLGVSEGWRSAPLAICGALIVLFSLVGLLTRAADLSARRV
ncbi:TRAP transporter small permease [Aurantimonas sp. MSK8Z-1]|uniref:TRAP transporter small permease n=1 Tax=Mangrovibrevibacter kandeliae TaxID=2968473 RepID=UPI002118B68B|nr:TRAP transporter small permease [Aurantimonas sp. MSK8Z-1]MCW4113457.1 TRAP transporter small permease [Aurantimonas sp. MSK8Z-1]